MSVGTTCVELPTRYTTPDTTVEMGDSETIALVEVSQHVACLKYCSFRDATQPLVSV